jgi:hypothetical protein
VKTPEYLSGGVPLFTLLGMAVFAAIASVVSWLL